MDVPESAGHASVVMALANAGRGVTAPSIATRQVTCGASPYQVEATLTDGRYVYMRARFRAAAVGVGVTARDAVDANLAATDAAYGSRPQFTTADGAAGAVWLADEDAGEFAVNRMSHDELDVLFDRLLADALG